MPEHHAGENRLSTGNIAPTKGTISIAILIYCLWECRIQIDKFDKFVCRTVVNHREESILIQHFITACSCLSEHKQTKKMYFVLMHLKC